MSEKNNRNTTAIFVEMIVLTAIVVMIQLLGCKIFGTLSTILCVIPVLFGSIISGNIGGAWLGFVYGICMLFQPESEGFLSTNVSAGFISCFIIGAAAGVATSIVCKIFANKKGKTIALFAGVFAWTIVKNSLMMILYVAFFKAIFIRLGFYHDSRISLFTKNVILQATLEIIVGTIASPIIVKLAELNEEKILKKHTKKQSETNENNSL